jgi:hypothetical protein
MFEVGDLITLKHHPGGPLAVVLGLEALIFGRILIQFIDGSRPEMAQPEQWKVVSRPNENR